ncbi:MAG: DUF3422 domain-containing protein [Gammaproteobacteria bacterium]|nr:DUF3422 domain-containing protein [Gammaproteobacteria bacterium]
MLPAVHPERLELNDEVHARPSGELRAPSLIGYLAMLSPSSERETEWRCLRDLLAASGVALPGTAAAHYSADAGAFTLRYERHGEFARYMFIVPGSTADPFLQSPFDALPEGFVAALPGRVIVAARGALLAAEEPVDLEAIATRWFDGNVLVGSRVSDDAAVALTDFRIREDGFSRFLLLDRSTSPRQAGRILQRVLEIDTYRMMALMSLPIARELGPFLSGCESELSQVTSVLEGAGLEEEATLLERLTRLQAQIEVRAAANAYRFGASAAYYDLVQRRIAELREGRLPGLQPFGEFMERRLAPAMNTCRAVAARQNALSDRVARANQLLATRVDITRERQNQALLESMDRRARAQLRLQQTVEGLSIAAVTYYVVGLIVHLAAGLASVGLAVAPELVAGASIPFVALTVGVMIHRIRHRIVRSPD